MIVGIDEVGRGAWAGPMTVGAVALGDAEIAGLTDSKKLTAKKREKLTLEIKQKAAAVGLGWVSAKVIDQIGLSAALKLAARRAMSQINVDYDQIIIDGTINLFQGSTLEQVDLPSQGLPLEKREVEIVTMARADLLVPSVSAASIVAKVARDEYMKIMDAKFPGYKFAAHVGYGTAAHSAALAELGASPIHRMSFAPLSTYYNTSRDQKGSTFLSEKDDIGIKMLTKNTTKVGNNAEEAVCEHVRRQGYTIIDRNWKTKWCEVDIIAERKGIVHFIEVKYRKNDRAGSGLAAITPKKLRQMKFAAELWLANKDVQQAVLSAVEVSGEEFVISEFIEVI